MLRMAVRPPSSSPTSQPLHAFKPTSGMVLGSIGLAVAGLVVVLVLLGERSVLGLRTALAAALVGLVVWMVLLRPRVRAYADTLELRNMASDVLVPLAAVDAVTVRHALHVWVDDERYTCPGIGRSTRSMVRTHGGTQDASVAKASSSEGYVRFVETTLEDLARTARRDARGEQPPVRRRWAAPELVAAGVLVVALVVSFLL